MTYKIRNIKIVDSVPTVVEIKRLQQMVLFPQILILGNYMVSGGAARARNMGVKSLLS